MKGRRQRSIAETAFYAWVLQSLMSTAVATTDPYATAEALYRSGEYNAAAQMASNDIGSAEAHALAARALLSKAITEVPFDQRLPVLEEAGSEADAAILANDNALEGYLQKLIAYGYISRMPDFDVDNIAAAKQSRKILDQAVRLEPENPWVLASLGGWNLEVAKRAPLGMGKVLFGATSAKGIEAFDRALALVPENVVIRYEYGLALLWLDRGKYRSKAQAALNDAIALQTDDAYSRFLQNRARVLLALIASKDRKKLKATIAAYRGEAPVKDLDGPAINTVQ